ncbi:hypothetical protein [Reyranella sp.]|uniref:hypothetical protein n=1 Tax=Reyranella sp. TaxID=1929291 RepID=UPI003D0B99AC
MTAPASEPWRLWMLLSVPRGTLGREIVYGWSSIANLQEHADTRLPAFNLQAENRETGERWQRVQGRWRKLAAPAPAVAEIDLEAEPPQPPRYYWQDRD